MKNKTQNTNALILIGGKSLRMGSDKSKLIYHNKPQKEHVFDLLTNFFPKENIFYSVRENQKMDKKQVITDKYPDLGPFGGILAAFEYDHTKAWFVIAIDLPFINEEHLKMLLKQRNLSKIATTFKAKEKKYPEPLITLWEKEAYSILKKQLQLKNYSLVSILKSNPIKIVEIEEKIIQNINTKEAFKEIKL